MSKSLEQRLPDRTGILISPFCFGVPAAVFGIVLAWESLHTGSLRSDAYTSARDEVVFGTISALASTLGPVGSMIVATLIVVAVGVWGARATMKYRRAVAADRAKFGLK